MTHAEWIIDYAPIDNPIVGGRPYGGKLIGLTLPELTWLDAQPALKRWTVINQNPVRIVPGVITNHRIGHFVTTNDSDSIPYPIPATAFI